MRSESGTPWRIVVFTDFPAVAALYQELFAAQGHRVVGLVTTPARSQGYLEVVRLASPEIDVLVSNHPRRWAAMLRPLRPDLIVSTVFGHRLPAELLALPRHGAVNLHPALLPRYRGTSTPNWMIWNGEREGGWSLHRMVPELDAGPILAQAGFPLDESDDVNTFIAKAGSAIPAVWEAAWPRIERGDAGEPQDERQASYFGQMPEELRVIDWHEPASLCERRVRTWAGGIGIPGAIAEIEGRKVRILKARAGEGTSAPLSPAPGALLSQGGGTLRVQCGDLPLEILAYEPA